MKNNQKGQAAILMIFIIGMVGLLIGMTLSKTGFAESMMGRGTAGSTKAFYVANSGIEDAFYKISEADKADSDFTDTSGYTLEVGDGTATITVVTNITYSEDGTEENTEKIIESIGKYENYVRKIRVIAYDSRITPDFTDAILAGVGGIEMDNNVHVLGRDKDNNLLYVDIYSNSFIRGRNSGNEHASDCSSPVSTTQIYGNAFAVTNIESLGINGEGPCIDVNAYAKNLNNCRILGNYYYSENYSEAECPSEGNECDSTDVNCKPPEEKELPDIRQDEIKTYLEEHGDKYGTCIIGDENDLGENGGGCWTYSNDGVTPTIGNITIEGDLDTGSNQTVYLSGPVYVTGNVIFDSNQTISLDPTVEDDVSLIILASGKIISDPHVTFTSEGYKYLLLASEYEDFFDDDTSRCDETDGNAITVSANVSGILFYAINGCALVKQSAGNEYYGAIVGQMVKLKENVKMVYDPDLKNAEFYLDQEHPWQISSFTEY